MIRRKFPGEHVTVYKLRKLYFDTRIKMKCLRYTKLPGNKRTIRAIN
jgi:hypothetical protein